MPQTGRNLDDHAMTAIDLSTRTILIIDDTPANLEVMVASLEHHDFRVLVAEDGEEGLQRSILVQPDLILLDVVMPGVDGFDICRRLKNTPQTLDIPVIFMTAMADARNKIAGFEAGASDYVAKPFRIEEVVARINIHLKLRAMQKQLQIQNAQLHRHQEELERKVAERTTELSESNRRLRQENGERKRLETELRIKDHYQRALLDNFPFLVWLKDTESRFLAVNQPFIDATGLAPGTRFYGKTDIDVWPQDLAEKYRTDDQEVLHTGQKKIVEELVSDQGERKYYETYKAPVTVDGKLLGTVGFARDITMRKLLEQELALLHTALGTAHDACFLHDKHGNFLYVNAIACQALGYSAQELLRMHVSDVVPDLPIERWHVHLGELQAKGAMLFEACNRAKDGRLFPVEASLRYFEYENSGYVIAMVRNLTERKQAEALLRAREQEFRTLAENAPGIIARYDKECRRIYVNPAYLLINGVAAQNVLGKTPIEFSAAIKAQAVNYQAKIRQVLETGQAVEFTQEWRTLNKERVWYSVHAVPEYDHERQIVSVLVIAYDITPSKLMEEALRDSERQFRTLAENSPNIIIRYDLDCRHIFVNPAYVRGTGIAAKQALHVPPSGLWHTDINLSIEEYETRLQHVMETGIPTEIVLEWQHPVDRHVTSHAFHLVAEYGPEGQVVGALAIGHDITDLKRHEKLEGIRLQIFERLAQNGPLPELLALVAAYIETAHADFTCGIMLLDADGRHHDLIAPPATATPVTHQAQKTALLVCWSEPIFDSSGETLGTLVIYRRSTKRLSSEDIELIRQASYLAAIAIERKRGDEMLKTSEQRYRDIFDNVSDILYSLEVTEDLRFRYMEVNPAFEAMMNLPRAQIIGKYVGDLVPSPSFQHVVDNYRRCLEAGRPVDEELELELPTGKHHFHVALAPVYDDNGRIRLITGISRDITEQRQAEMLRHIRKQEFHALVEQSPDVIIRYDRNCRRIYVNPAYEKLAGAPAATLLGRTPMESSILTEVATPYQNMIMRVIATGAPGEIQLNLSTPGDKQLFHHVRAAPEFDRNGEVTSVLAIGWDITMLKETEQRLERSRTQLRELASRRENAREEERKRIARELHDELGQRLTGLRMDIGLIRLRHGSGNPQLLAQVQRTMTSVDSTIHVVRNVASSLRPAALDMGITSALEWLAEEFAKRSGIHCELLIGHEETALNDHQATAIFRIVQESLTNVSRHAQATQVVITLSRLDGSYTLEIRDNGKGFNPGAHQKKSFGLMGMRERVLMLGGELSIDAAPGHGVKISVRIPAHAS